MTKTDRDAFQRTLESRQTELAKGARSREPWAIETTPDELDRIQNARDRDYAMGNLERDSNRSRELRTALRRIDSGTFGICAGCEEEINPKRLAAVPWASFCIVCQEAADRGQTPAGIDETLLVMAA